MIDAVLVSILVMVMLGLNGYTTFLSWRTRKDMSDLERNTNSKMDAMLALTAKSSRAAGLQEGRDEKREPK
jgi:uncharacterized membrane protein